MKIPNIFTLLSTWINHKELVIIKIINKIIHSKRMNNSTIINKALISVQETLTKNV